MPVWIWIKHPFKKTHYILKKDDCDLESSVTQARASAFFLAIKRSLANRCLVSSGEVQQQYGCAGVHEKVN